MQENKKVMQLETALAMWQLLYADERRWQYIDDWCEFLQEHHKGRTVSKDTWAQLFEFARVSRQIRGAVARQLLQMYG
jgi:DCN1-like protein 1/2